MQNEGRVASAVDVGDVDDGGVGRSAGRRAPCLPATETWALGYFQCPEVSKLS